MTIDVYLNGEPTRVTDTTLAAALQHWGYRAERIAVAIDAVFVPRSQYGQRRLQAGERIEVLAPVQGG